MKRLFMKFKVCVVTTTRADYGPLYPIIKQMTKERLFDLQLVVSGTHLLEEFGTTKNEIISDGFKNITEVPIIQNANSAPCEILSRTIKQFDKTFKKLKPDIVVILGDRYEMVAVASVCLMLGIQLAHISGGDVTYGAIDDACRHAITKMANLHFAGSQVMKNRIIQMGENPEVVINAGEPGVENILNTKLMTLEEINKSLNFQLKEKKFALVTYHPETICEKKPIEQIKELIDFIKSHTEIDYIITKSNIDNGGDEINNYILDAIKDCKNVTFISSLGRVRYLSCVKHALVVIGNSSSGLTEVPYLLTPTINIGNRQQGRECESSVINCELEKTQLENAFQQAKKHSVVKPESLKNLYGDGNTSKIVVGKIKEYLGKENLSKKKIFYHIGE